MDCSCLIHPFQNDPGTSQRQRVMEDLLSGAAKIDARSLADLLDYFVQLSRHINYYDTDLNTDDWQPFFKNSVPFTLASIIRYKVEDMKTNFTLYNSLFEKHPSSEGLQLNAFFIYYRFINNINEWHLTLKDSSLPLGAAIGVMIRNKLQQPVKKFIQYCNAAVGAYGIKRIDFSKLNANPIWGLDLPALYAVDASFSQGTRSKRRRLENLYNDLKALFPAFLENVRGLSKLAEKDLEQSFIPLKEDLQKKHQPHLALLFAFLNMFRQLQDDLNQYTRKHLDLFYRDILQIKADDAVPDKAHVVFEIQKQLQQYLVKKGLKVKDGKDNNKQEILFSLDDEIVVTKTTLADKRTLFLNNQEAYAHTYLEGVYIAPVAGEADGVAIDFKDDPKNFYTLGAKYSKYTDPLTKLLKPHPNARLGFILASPVLFLQAGSTRTIGIDLDCHIDDTICDEMQALVNPSAKGCCGDGAAGAGSSSSIAEKFPGFYLAESFFTEVETALEDTWYYFNQDLLKLAMKKGIDDALVQKLRDHYLLGPNEHFDPSLPQDYCNCPGKKDKYEGILNEAGYFGVFADPAERQILSEWIKPRKALNVLFSGEKEWVEPVIGKPAGDPQFGLNLSVKMLSLAADNKKFTLKIVAVLPPDKPAVTFYNPDALKEDIGATQPVVKIELDDKIKLMQLSVKGRPALGSTSQGCCAQTEDCCLLIEEADDKHDVSLYHFFRDVKLDPVADPNKAMITVNVCGLKNFIVQNDESVMDVNGPVYPFGARPKIESNFYIGSEEIFLKKWSDIYVNLNWKDKPAIFTDYYNGYQDFFIQAAKQVNVVEDNKFRMQLAILQDGKWTQWKYNEDCTKAGDPQCQLFQPFKIASFCSGENFSNQFPIHRSSDFGTSLDSPVEEIKFIGYKNLDVNTRHSFIRVTLKCQDFQHDKYSFVLARQMAAMGKLPDIVDGAVYYGVVLNGITPQFEVLNIPVILQQIMDKYNLSLNPDLLTHLQDLIIKMNALAGAAPGQITNQIWKDLFVAVDPVTGIAPHNLNDPPYVLPPAIFEHSDYYATLFNILDWLKGLNDIISKIKDKGVVLPKEPWTPAISNISLDYKAVATAADINLVHLYPYTGTYMQEVITGEPSLFPTLCDEGTLFLGLKDLMPGDNLTVLFQLAEATSDSESNKEIVFWYYLDSNVWRPLRTGFELVDDATKNLTTSGILKFSLPGNMTKDNTVMPKDLYWIKAAIPKNSGSVSETSGIFTQAVVTTFTNDPANDKLRLATPLAAGSISKLNEADASIKSVTQPYDSFGGTVPEIESQFYVRVSETLRHKGRAIQAFDYERLALQAFPQLFKVKCINHSFALNAHEYSNDFPYAPGYIILAVIPDLRRLKAGNSFEPKVPVSLLEDIDAFIRRRTSPFVRFRSINPRYEKINFCIRVQLLKGKDQNYYREKLKQDIREFLAPWAIGVYDKLTFGQCVFRSDIIRLLETSDYVDFITDFRMGKEGDAPDVQHTKVCPHTPRSILIAGDIEVCIDEASCEHWGPYQQCEEEGPVAPCAAAPEKIIELCK